MARCNSCNGIIGVDCFNPTECAFISEQIENNERHEMENRIRELEEVNGERYDIRCIEQKYDYLINRINELENKIEKLKVKK